MRRIKRTSTRLAAAALALASASAASVGFAAESTGAENGVVASTWQHHKVTFPFNGLTSKYNCNGLEESVRHILVHFGARNDAKVSAGGCGPGSSAPGGRAFIDADFYTLAPAADSGSADTVAAHWTAKHLDPNHPYFMDYGSCELIQQMQDLITKNFAIQNLQYRTDCFPHDLNLHGFSVKGMALTAVSTAKS
jgi:hypothetical protein